MTSHSPITVAALDEADIYQVVRTAGDVKVSGTTKSEAVNELSEGLATVDVGLRIAAYDEARVTILTEGNNAKHLKRWAQLHFPEDVHVCSVTFCGTLINDAVLSKEPSAKQEKVGTRTLY